MSNSIIQHKFSIPNIGNIKYKVLKSVCPRLHLPGHAVEIGRSVPHGVDNQSFDQLGLDKYRFSTRRHGCQCLLLLGTGYITPTPLSSSAVVLVLCMEHTGQEA